MVIEKIRSKIKHKASNTFSIDDIVALDNYSLARELKTFSGIELVEIAKQLSELKDDTLVDKLANAILDRLKEAPETIETIKALYGELVSSVPRSSAVVQRLKHREYEIKSTTTKLDSAYQKVVSNGTPKFSLSPGQPTTKAQDVLARHRDETRRVEKIALEIARNVEYKFGEPEALGRISF